MDKAGLLSELLREVDAVQLAAAELEDDPAVAAVAATLQQMKAELGQVHATTLERRFVPPAPPRQQWRRTAPAKLPSIEKFVRKKKAHHRPDRPTIHPVEMRAGASPRPLSPPAPAPRAPLRTAPLPRAPNQPPTRIISNAGFFVTFPATAPPEKVPPPPPSPKRALLDMDMSFFHQITIRNGRVDDKSPEYLSYRRTYADYWEEIKEMLNRLAQMSQKFHVKSVVIDGFKLARMDAPTNLDLLDCIPAEMRSHYKIPGMRFRGDAKANAASYIQASQRMKMAKRLYVVLLRTHMCAKVIQKWCRARRRLEATRAKIAEVRAARLTAFEEIQAADPDFSQRMIEVHICSMTSLPQSRRDQEMAIRQAAPISRIFRILDQEVDVVLVVPAPLDEELLEYFVKVLQYRGIRNPPGRLQVVAPENLKLLPNASLTSALIWSPKALKRIRQLIAGRRAGVVPYACAPLEMELCALLGARMLAAPPAQATKSYGLRLLRPAVPTVVSAMDLYSKKECYAALARLIQQHPTIESWVFKLEDEFEARGVGTIDMSSLKMVNDVRRKLEDKRAAALAKGEASDGWEKKEEAQILQVLEKYLAKRVQMGGAGRPWTFKEYLEVLPASGGIIQALPRGVTSYATIHLNVSTRGKVEVEGTSEAFSAFSFFRCLPAGAPWPLLQEVGQKVGAELLRKRIFGFASVDCILCPATGEAHSSAVVPRGALGELRQGEELYAVDLDLHMTATHSALFMFLFMTRTYFDETGQLRSAAKSQEVRVCAVTTSLYAPGTMSGYPQLFELFNAAKLSFDLVEDRGTVLLQADVRAQCVTLGAVSTTSQKAIAELTAAVEIFDRKQDGDIFQVLSMLRMAGGGQSIRR